MRLDNLAFMPAHIVEAIVEHVNGRLGVLVEICADQKTAKLWLESEGYVLSHDDPEPKRYYTHPTKTSVCCQTWLVVGRHKKETT